LDVVRLGKRLFSEFKNTRFIKENLHKLDPYAEYEEDESDIVMP